MSEKPILERPTAILAIGYKLKLAVSEAMLPEIMPDFSDRVPSNYKDPIKIQEKIEELKASWFAEAARTPYLCTFDAVQINDVVNERSTTLFSKDRGLGDKKRPISLVVRSWLLKHYPKAWHDELVDRKKPEVIFVGFEPRQFLKVLGIECSLPGYDSPLPVSLWYNTLDHRDITEACMPAEHQKRLDWRLVLSRRQVAVKEGWSGPGDDAIEDARIVGELGAQLGFFKKRG